MKGFCLKYLAFYVFLGILPGIGFTQDPRVIQQSTYEPCLTCPVVTFYLKEEATEQDSVPLHLLTPVAVLNNSSIWITPWPGEYPPWDIYPRFEIYPPIYWTSWSYVVAVPACGDNYYDNGQLSSHIECVDSVMHGKAIFYDETGHKTQESTYSKGHQIKYKSYDDRGRLANLYHYDYSGLPHGVNVNYDYYSNVKTVSHYDHGELHGAQEEYRDGILESKKIYHKGELKEEMFYYSNGHISDSTHWNPYPERFHFNDSGRLVSQEYTNEGGEYQFLRRWSDAGILVCENLYEKGVPAGTWLVSFEPITGQRITETYENGKKILNLVERESRVLEETHYNPSDASRTVFIQYTTGADTLVYRRYANNENKVHEKVWNPEGRPTQDLEMERNSSGTYILSGAGYYTLRDTLYHYAIDTGQWAMIEKRFVVWRGDTVRQEYVRNDGALQPRPEVFATNYFTQVNDDYLRDFQWVFYHFNNLDSVINYKQGQRNGRAVYYQSGKDSVFLVSAGNYKNNQEDGIWMFRDSQEFMTRFENWEIAGDSLLVTYKLGELEGSWQEYSQSGTLLVSGNLVRNQREGQWFFYDETGTVVKWIRYKNGEIDKTKILKAGRKQSDESEAPVVLRE